MYLCRVTVSTEIYSLESNEEKKIMKNEEKVKLESIGYSIEYFQNSLKMVNNIPVYKVNQKIYK